MRPPEVVKKLSEKMHAYWGSNPRAEAHRRAIKRRNSRPTVSPKSHRLTDRNFEARYILEKQGLRRCLRCNSVLPLDKFWKAGDGEKLQSQCKECARLKQIERRKTYKDPSPEKVRARSKRWREAHPELARQRIKECRLRNPEVSRQKSKLRRAAIRSNDPRRVTLKDVDRMLTRQRRMCYLCRGPLCNPELDHIIPIKKGGRHSIGNLAWACKKCNRDKWKSLLVEYRYA